MRPPQSEAGRVRAARRRLRQAIELLTQWLGHRPRRILLWSQDFDRIKNKPADVELVRRPPPAAG